MLVRNRFKCIVCSRDIKSDDIICDEYKDIPVLDLINYMCRREIVLPRGYEMVSIFRDRFVFAINKDKNELEPWGVWSIDFRGKVYGGSYYSSKADAEANYFNKILNYF
ncbi:MAG: hypothetical protein ACRDA4_00310 [Filifactoraceae bacterium]